MTSPDTLADRLEKARRAYSEGEITIVDLRRAVTALASLRLMQSALTNDRGVIERCARAARRAHLNYWKLADQQEAAFTSWSRNGRVGPPPDIQKTGPITDYIENAILSVSAAPVDQSDAASTEAAVLRDLVVRLSDCLTNEGPNWSSEGLDALRRAVADTLAPDIRPEWLTPFAESDEAAPRFVAPKDQSGARRNAVIEECAAWHDQRARNTPDAFESEFHEVSAKAIRALTAAPAETVGRDAANKSKARLLAIARTKRSPARLGEGGLR